MNTVTADRPKTKDHQTVHFGVDAGQLVAGLKRCELTVSTEETRYYLNGTLLKVTDRGDAWLVSTDGHQLTKFLLPTLVAEEHAMCEEIISRECIDALIGWALRNTLPSATLAIELTTWLEEHWTPGTPKAEWVKRASISLFDPGRFNRFDCKLIDGIFPDVERVIPRRDRREHMATFNARELRKAIEELDRAGKGSETMAMRVAVDGRDMARLECNYLLQTYVDQPHVLTRGPRRGQTVMRKVEGEVKKWTSERIVECQTEVELRGFEVGFNRHYLLGLLKGARRTVSLIGTDESSPWLIEVDGNKGLTIVLMPCRV